MAAILYKHEDGRYAVNPNTLGDPAWHRLGPVDVSELAPHSSSSNEQRAFERAWKARIWGFNEFTEEQKARHWYRAGINHALRSALGIPHLPSLRDKVEP